MPKVHPVFPPKVHPHTTLLPKYSILYFSRFYTLPVQHSPTCLDVFSPHLPPPSPSPFSLLFLPAPPPFSSSLSLLPADTFSGDAIFRRWTKMVRDSLVPGSRLADGTDVARIRYPLPVFALRAMDSKLRWVPSHYNWVSLRLSCLARRACKDPRSRRL